MDPLKTPEFSSDRMKTALGISAYHANAKQTRDNADWKEYSDWHFRSADWDPCYNVSVNTDLRNANYSIIAKNKELYKNKENNKEVEYKNALPSNTAMNVYPSAKLGFRHQ